MSKIRLSKLAGEVLFQTIKESNIPLDKGLRIERFEGGLTLVTDRPSKDDRVIKKGRGIVLIIDKQLEEQVGEALIDISNISNKLKLVIIKSEDSGKVQLGIEEDSCH